VPAIAAVVVFGDHLVCGNGGVGGQDGLVEFAEPFRADLESYPRSPADQFT
jgi:hypothetical protein